MTEPSFLRDTRAAYNSVAAAYAERFQGELAPGHVAALLGEAGLDLRAQLIREPYEGQETDQRAYLLARKPPGRS